MVMRGSVAYHKEQSLKGSMRENGFRAIGSLAQRLASGMAKGRNASIGRLRAEWSAIVGPELARVTRPEALLSARGSRGGSGAAGKFLRLRVPGAAALEAQHRSGQIVDRVNAYFGYRMIDDIRLVQGAVVAPPRPRPAPAPDPATEQAVASRTSGVVDPALRAALTRLGTRVVTGRRSAIACGLGALFMGREVRAQGMTKLKLMGALPGDHVLGRPDAPNILIDYASFTCPHCANFNAAVVPVLRRDWIETGKLRLIHRHFPGDSVATRASQLAECAGPDKFFTAVDTLFRTQVQWMTAADPETELLSALDGLGIGVDAAQACLANDLHLDKVIADVQSGQTLGVTFTPTIFINEQNYGSASEAAAIAAILGQVGR